MLGSLPPHVQPLFGILAAEDVRGFVSFLQRLLGKAAGLLRIVLRGRCPRKRAVRLATHRAKIIRDDHPGNLPGGGLVPNLCDFSAGEFEMRDLLFAGVPWKGGDDDRDS